MVKADLKLANSKHSKNPGMEVGPENPCKPSSVHSSRVEKLGSQESWDGKDRWMDHWGSLASLPS